MDNSSDTGIGRCTHDVAGSIDVYRLVVVLGQFGFSKRRSQMKNNVATLHRTCKTFGLAYVTGNDAYPKVVQPPTIARTSSKTNDFVASTDEVSTEASPGKTRCSGDKCFH